MSQRTAEHLAELVKWRDFHTTDDMSVQNHIKFLEKTVDNLLEVLTDFLEDVTAVEGRPADTLGRLVWTPNGVRRRA